GDSLRAIEAVHRGLEIVPENKLPHDYFSIGPAKVLIRAGKIEEGEMLLRKIIDYSEEYLEYSISLRSGDRYGLDYPSGINMQALLDIYNFSLSIKDEKLTTIVEPLINKYYEKLYSVK
ncbi:MAG: hypothetical protein QG576_938, partial [Bacteroidota bacterium]|nr:hypothetical protein [Bacteroidota bacterium]